MIKTLLSVCLVVCLLPVFATNTISSTSPTANSIDVALDASITLTFGATVAAMDATSANIIVVSAQNGPVAGAFSGGGTSTITFDPTSDFNPGDQITVTITETILASAHSFAFTTITGALDEPAFGKSSVSTSADFALEVAIADLNGDGHLDLLSASFDDNKIAWYENDGGASPTFSSGTSITTSASGASHVLAGDIDNDGDMDVLSASSEISSNKIAWYENDGAGTPSFTEIAINTTLSGASHVAIGDLDGDGDLDVLSTSRNDNTISWYENDGAADPSFTTHDITTSATDANYVSVGDIDGDGDLDVAAVYSSTFVWFENDGASDPSFTENSIATSISGASSIYLGDVDGDQDLDAAVIYNFTISWYENDGAADPSFTENEIDGLAFDANELYLIDIDGDGDLDVLSASAGNDEIAWYENDGASDPGFTDNQIASGNDFEGVKAADIDGDGDLDIAAVSSDNDEVSWLAATSTATNFATFTVSDQVGDATIDVDAHTVNAKVLASTSLTSLSPTFTLSDGATASPVSGSSQVFTNAVTYTITAEDGTTTQDWTVTIENASGETDITSFEVTNQLGDTDIDATNHTVDIQVLFGTDLTNLSPTIGISDQATISPTSGTSQNFSSSVVYTVTAEDGTTQDWTVSIAIYAGATTGFVTQWTTDNNGTSNDDQITIPTTGDGYNYTVSWGDGNSDNNVTGDITHTYSAAGTYTVTITGSFPRIYFNGQGDSDKIISIDQWGDNLWLSMEGAFSGCENMSYAATDAPNLSIVESTSSMFSSAASFNGDIGDWDVSNVTNMSGMFANATAFDQDIDDWDVSNVTTMRSMFFQATSFDQLLFNWELSSMEDLAFMFAGTNFNSNITPWDVSTVTDMSGFLEDNELFNHDISGWDVSNVTDMSNMFSGTEAFDRDLGSWDVSSVTDMGSMFANADFNQDISGWNVSNVTDMRSMFINNTSFDQDLSGWDVSNVTDMTNMLNLTAISTANYDALLEAWADLTLQDDVVFGVSGLTYCEGSGDRTNIVNVYNWTFSDDVVCSSETEITFFGLNEQFSSAEFDETNSIIRILVDAGTDLTSITPASIQISDGATISPAADAAQDFSSSVSYTVTAEDGTTTETWVVIATEVSTGTDITEFSLDERSEDATIDDTNHTVTFDLPANQDITALTPSIEISDNATISPESGVVQDFSEDVVYTVTAQDGTTQEWTVSVISLQGATTAFITTWKTDNSGSSEENQITIPVSGSDYNYTVNWGDGLIESGVEGSITHTYQEAGTYTVSITGAFPRIFFNGFGDAAKLMTIEQWGDNPWISMLGAFSGCSNLEINATDAPDLSMVTDMTSMFANATSLDSDLSAWDVSNVTNMGAMFFGASSFDQPLDDWDVSNVTNMNSMFNGATSFNQEINSWDVSNVTNMVGMFSAADAFNQDIGSWDVSSVTDFSSTFSNADSFNQDIGDWDVSSATDMGNMFSGAFAFNQDISSWEIGAVTNVSAMFQSATSFNQDIGGWDVSNVEFMGFMFSGASSFNQDISSWDVSNVESMEWTFGNAMSFNQDLSSWDVSNVTSFRSMFNSAVLFDQDLSSWDVSNATILEGMFSGAKAFNSDIGGWDVRNVTDISVIFANTETFNQDISSWDVSNVTDMNSAFAGATAFNQDIGGWDVSRVTDMGGMFSSASVFNQDISGWDVSSVQSMNNMLGSFSFQGSRFSTDNYEKLLIAWSQLDLEQNVIFGANDIFYCTGSEERQKIIDDFNWTIFDDGQQCDRTDVLAFVVDEEFREASINNFGRTIELVVERGTDLTSLTPTLIEITGGATISPGAGEAQDFSEPVIYTIAAEDGTTSREYTVTAREVANGTDILNEISFFVRDYSIEIDPEAHTVVYTRRLGTDLTQQSLSFDISEFATISPFNGSVQNFSESVTYTITAEDGTVQDWIVSMDIFEPATTPFITTWQTDLVPSTTDNEVTIPTSGSGYNYTVQWGDGTMDENVTGNITHVYDEAGTYQVEITGHFPGFFSNGDDNSDRLVNVDQWGDNPWQSMAGSFFECDNLNIDANDVPDLTFVRTMNSMFFSADGFNSDLSSWDFSRVENFGFMLGSARSFNQSLAGWDITGATVMGGMLNFSGMLIDNYDATLMAWSQLDLPEDIFFSAQNVSYCMSESARQSIIDDFGWTIDGDNLSCPAETDILSFEFAEQTSDAIIDFGAHTVLIEVGYAADITALAPNIEISLFATISPASDEVQDFTEPVTYTVTSFESINVQDWVVTVTQQEEPDTDILTFTLPEQQGNAVIDLVAHTVDIRVRAETDVTNLTPTITVSEGATINPESEEGIDFSNPVVYTVTGDDGIITQEWTVNVEIAPVLSVSDLGEIRVFPNPMGNYLRVELDAPSSDHKISITDLQGKTVVEELPAGKTSYAVPVDHLPVGLYLFTIRKGDIVTTYRLIKN